MKTLKNRIQFYQKTSCLITADGSVDSQSQPGGLPTYAEPPVFDAYPLPYTLKLVLRDPLKEENEVDDSHFGTMRDYGTTKL